MLAAKVGGMSQHSPAPEHHPAPTVAANRRRIGPIFAGLLVAMLLSSLDQTIFGTALPTIVGELNGVDHMLWVTTAYLVAATIMMPIYGKLGDLLGRKSIFIGALVVFLAGSIVGGLAQDMTWLIIGRAIQGMGGGGLMILSQAIIADVVPVRERSKYMGVMGAVFGVSSVAGPLLGGWFTESIGWRWAFWINIPLGIAAIVCAALFLKLPRHSAKVTLDLWGIATMAVAVTSIILVTSWGGTEYEWTSPVILILIAMAVGASAAFVWAERRASEPIIPLELFISRNFVLATAAGLFIGVAMFGAVAYMPTYLQMVTGVSATNSGLLMVSMIAGVMLTAITTGVLASRTGRYKWMPITGMVLIALGLGLLSTLTPTTPLPVLLAYLFCLGMGVGFGMQILVLIVQNSFPDAIVGTATAANNFFREIGASMGGAVVGAMFTSRLTTLLAERLPAEGAGTSTNSLTPAAVNALPDTVREVIVGAYNDALTPVFALLVPMIAVGLIILVFIKEVPLRTTSQTSPLPESSPSSGQSSQADEAGTNAAEDKTVAAGGTHRDALTSRDDARPRT